MKQDFVQRLENMQSIELMLVVFPDDRKANEVFDELQDLHDQKAI